MALSWQDIEAAFHHAIALNGEPRRAFLAALPDPQLRAEVDSLLAAVTGSPGILTGLVGSAASTLEPAVAEREHTVGPGSRFGHYRVEAKLGQGGLGDVYQAVRDDDFHKRVALKIVRWGMDSDFARRRFEQERQMLAGLEHPNIARLLDGGDTDGCPYLVLEYVDGVPINRYCNGLSCATIVRLFLKVCDAVDYAHRSLIIHRDLKPANIMVTAGGEPKLLDFGIAKLLDSGGGEVTQTIGMAAMTPQYASPEQVRGDPITTASDVYSLSVVLYELLTNRKPYDVSTSSMFELDRVICVQPPDPPCIDDDLDQILLMGLRKEPARRYGSVQQFAQDLACYLDGKPVSARPDTAWYRARKFTRRHWVGLSAAMVAAAGLCIGAGVAIHQARVAQDRFQLVRGLAHSFVFDYDDALAKVDGNIAVREKMVGTALQYLDMLSASAGTDAGLLTELAGAYQKVGDVQGYPTRPSLGHADQAIASYRKAAAIHERIAARDPGYRRASGSFYIDFAHLLRLNGNYEDARQMGEAARSTLERFEHEHPSDDAVQLDLAGAWCVLADIAGDTGHAVVSLAGFTHCDAIVRGVLARSPTQSNLRRALQSSAGLAAASQATGHVVEALAAFDQNEKILAELMRAEPGNPNLRRNQALLGQWRSGAYYDLDEPNLNDPARSLPYARQYLEAAREMVRRDPKNNSSQLSLAIAHYRLSNPLKFTDPAAAVAEARESVRLFDMQLTGGKGAYLFVSRRPRALRRLSEALLVARYGHAASTAASEAVDGQRSVATRDSRDIGASALLALMLITSAQSADALHDRNRAEVSLMEAESMAAKIYAANRQELPALIPLTRVRAALGEHWRIAGDLAQSQHWFDEALRLWREFPDQNSFVRREADAVASRRPALPAAAP